MTGGRWYQVLDLFAQDLRVDVVTFNCAVASCEEIRSFVHALGGDFCCGNSGLGQSDFSFGFRRCMFFSWFFGMGVIGATQKGGKLPPSGISSLFLEESREVTGRSVLCSG